MTINHKDVIQIIKSHLSYPVYRPDIDGLRALAVLPVVAFHAFPDVVKGGFIGVDIFFVISGYLISTIIFSSLDKGVFSFTEFYARRIKRIFPALILVLAASYAFGWFALLADEYKQLGMHITGGAGFFSNVVLWNEAGYFDNASDTKPLLHLWSLGIEEQFYIVWPLLLWVACKVRINFLALTLLIAGVSFYFNMSLVQSNTVTAFYLPHTRFWELLGGSLLAWIVLYRKAVLESINTQIANVCSLVGLLLLVFGFWCLDKDIMFPGYWAVIPVMGAMLVILAGLKAWINRVILSNRIAVWFGLISFPLYLWHWPLLSFLRIVESETPGVYVRISAVLLSIVLAWLTFIFVEKPVRFGKQGKYKVPTLVVLMAVLGGIGFYTYKQNGLEFRVKDYITNTAQFTMPELKANRDLCKFYMGEYKGHCVASLNAGSPNALDILFVGDSHGEALSIGLVSEGFNHQFMSLGIGGCLPLVGVERFTENGPFNCEVYMEPAFDLIRNHDFKNTILIMVARYSAYVEGSGYGYADNVNRAPGNLHIQKKGAKISAYDGLYQETFRGGLVDTLRFFSGRFKRIVIVEQVPELGFDPKLCVLRPFRFNAPTCTLPKADVLVRQRDYRKALQQAIAEFPDVSVYDPLDVFCDSTWCSAIHEGDMLYRDDDHVGVLGASRIIKDMIAKGYL